MVNRIYSPIPVATLIGSILLAYVLDRFSPIIEVVPKPLNLIGWLLVIVGLALTTYSVSMLISRRTTPDPGGVPSSLLTKGPYAFSRNPIYFADLIIATGAAIILSSLAAFVAPFLFLVIVNSVVIPFEERNLRQVFGQEYEKYQRSVRRWL